MEENETVTEPATEEEIPQEEVVQEHDPGQLEGSPKEEPKREGPPEGSPRWNDIYYQAQEGKRQVESLTQKIQELERREQERLQEQPQAPVQQTPQVAEEVPKQDAQLDVLKESLKVLRSDRRQAKIDMDGVKEAEIQDKIEDIQQEIMELKFAEQSKINPTVITKAMKEQQVKVAADNFANSNKWFGTHKLDGTPNPDYDFAMHGAAIALEANMAKTWKGSYSDMLTEIGRKVEARFNPPAEKPKVAVVGSVSNMKQAEAKPDRLTAEEEKAALAIYPDSKTPYKDYQDLKLSYKLSQGAN